MSFEQLSENMNIVFKNAPLDKALEIFVNEVCKMLNWEYGEVWMPDYNNDFLLFSSSNQITSPQLINYKKFSKICKFSSNNGLIGKAFSESSFIVNQDLLQDKSFLRNDAALNAGLNAGYAFRFNSPDNIFVIAFFVRQHKPENVNLIEKIIELLNSLNEIKR